MYGLSIIRDRRRMEFYQVYNHLQTKTYSDCSSILKYTCYKCFFSKLKTILHIFYDVRNLDFVQKFDVSLIYLVIGEHSFKNTFYSVLQNTLIQPDKAELF